VEWTLEISLLLKATLLCYVQTQRYKADNDDQSGNGA
jgi:hypothetical protein